MLAPPITLVKSTSIYAPVQNEDVSELAAALTSSEWPSSVRSRGLQRSVLRTGNRTALARTHLSFAETPRFLNLITRYRTSLYGADFKCDSIFARHSSLSSMSTAMCIARVDVKPSLGNLRQFADVRTSGQVGLSPFGACAPACPDNPSKASEHRRYRMATAFPQRQW